MPLPVTLEGEQPELPSIKDILKERKKSLDLFRELLPSLQQTGKDILTDPEQIRKYPAYMINQAMSYHMDCLVVAAEMNKIPGIPNRCNYLVYLNTIRKYKRQYVKWKSDSEGSSTNNEHKATIISLYYGYSMRYARTVTNLYSDAQIKKMEEQIEMGD